MIVAGENLRDDVATMDGTILPGRWEGNLTVRQAQMANYLEQLMLDAGEDDETGDSGWFGMHVARFGRRILSTDERGFVIAHTYPTTEIAAAVFAAIEEEYAQWSEEQ